MKCKDKWVGGGDSDERTGAVQARGQRMGDRRALGQRSTAAIVHGTAV